MRRLWKVYFLKSGESRACLNVHRKGLVDRERLRIQEKEGITNSIRHGKVRGDIHLVF